MYGIPKVQNHSESKEGLLFFFIQVDCILIDHLKKFIACLFENVNLLIFYIVKVFLIFDYLSFRLFKRLYIITFIHFWAVQLHVDILNLFFLDWFGLNRFSRHLRRVQAVLLYIFFFLPLAGRVSGRSFLHACYLNSKVDLW